MFKRFLSVALALSVMITCLCGCSKKLKLEDVANAPRKNAEQAIEKLNEKYMMASDPLETAASAARKGAFEIKFTTTEGEKVVVTTAQDLATDKTFTEWKNSATNEGWATALQNSTIAVRPGLNGDWYSLSFDNFDENIKTSQLSEVLNQSDKVITNKIRNKYCHIGKATSSDGILDILLKVIKNAEVTTEAGWAEIDGEMEDAIIVNYSMTPEMMSELVGNVIEHLDQEQYGHSAYLKNLVRECLRQAGCDFYKSDSSDTLSEQLDLAGMQIEKFYKETDSNTNLLLAINPKTGALVNLSFVIQDSVNNETVSLIFNFVFNDSRKDGYSGKIEINMCGLGAAYSDFDIRVEFECVNDGEHYTKSNLISFTNDLIKWRVSDIFTYSRNDNSYSWKKVYDDQDLMLEGFINNETGFDMSISNVQFADFPEKQIGLEIKAKEYAETKITDTLDICALTEKQTTVLIQSASKYLPVIVFGDWNPWEKVDLSVFEEFQENYDYDKNGVIDERDRAYFDHVNSLLKSTE